MASKLKILVVDDEEKIRNALQDILESKGYKVSIAKDGKEGLKQFAALEPGLIITDIIMPDMEGIEFIRAIAKKKKNTPIIVMSGNILGAKFLESARIFGTRACLKKPFTAQELMKTIEKLLINKRKV